MGMSTTFVSTDGFPALSDLLCERATAGMSERPITKQAANQLERPGFDLICRTSGESFEARGLFGPPEKSLHSRDTCRNVLV